MISSRHNFDQDFYLDGGNHRARRPNMVALNQTKQPEQQQQQQQNPQKAQPKQQQRARQGHPGAQRPNMVVMNHTKQPEQQQPQQGQQIQGKKQQQQKLTRKQQQDGDELTGMLASYRDKSQHELGTWNNGMEFSKILLYAPISS